jgi:hypothetical protein
MRRIIGFTAAALLLGGCASYAWYRPDATPRMAASDERFCRSLASDPVNELAVGAWSPTAGWGWRPWDGPWRRPWMGPWPDPASELAAEQRVLDRCMRARGYDLVRVDPPR